MREIRSSEAVDGEFTLAVEGGIGKRHKTNRIKTNASGLVILNYTPVCKTRHHLFPSDHL
jgi:hypothetical protein